MDKDKNIDEFQNILDISKPSTSSENTHAVKSSENDGANSYYFSSTQNEQILVNKFLDGEMNFAEYIENVGIEENVDEVDVGSTEAQEAITDNSLKVEKSGLPSRSKKPQKLPPALKGLMGEANLRFARGDKETAVKICLEIIRQVPTAPEPFLTLAGIYDEMGDQEKFLQMSLVAAHLSSSDPFEWIHLAELSEKLGHIRQAVTCYSKAINLDIFNMDLHKKRATLLEKLGDKKTAVRGYLRLLSALKPEQGELILVTSKFIAELCHKESDFVKASNALDVAIEKCPNLINLEFINLQLELLIQLKQFQRCLDLMIKFCSLNVVMDSVGEVSDCTIPPDSPIDILAKLIIVLIHLRSISYAEQFLNRIADLNPAEVGDLYLDVIDAFVEQHYYEKADKLLSVLVHCAEYSLPAVWLKYAENLKVLGRLEESVKAFYAVLEQAPQHTEARMTLSSLLVQLGRNDEAIVVLTQNEDYDYLDVGLFYERCLLLKRDKQRSDELIMVSQVFFSRHSTHIRNRDELSCISIIQRYDKKRNAVKQVRKTRKEPEDDIDNPSFRKENHGPTVEEEWELFKYVCNLCIETKRYNAFQRLTFTAQLSTIFHVYKYEINLLSVLAAYYNKDSFNGYNIIRTLVAKEPNNVRLWHLFNLIITKSDDSRHHRFIMRQLARNCDHPALGLLHGNNCLVSGTYKYAMHEYSSAQVKNPTALGALLLGLTYLQMAAQKFTSKKHHLVVQALGLLTQYRDLRGPEGLQEVHYNLGRGFHHLGLLTQAIFHYKKVLELKGLFDRQNPIFDLSREAAFNLHLIYCQSESYELAKMYLEKYVTI
ncbi:general transcription factor 3C polypeptide 3 [Halyomorpha halys]|uniref:general transcription factor 3C polypeptide 3 n=1 Tax=Halyomorpha halys TaxID=286706 RepID=UPI0006D4E138|nr:general transcription factor 3C polypeptide 3 [Halyomorpha halys]XP_014270627.1 general transcription factor 3C polypeptide 3 [Halyomorpha halys]